jgi:two-component system response regulator GlrR
MDDADKTLVHFGDFGFSRTVMLREPQLSWLDARGSHSALLRGRHVVGSAENCDLVVRSPEVSRLHAAFEVRDDGVWVRDLGSRNGTWVNGVMVREARVPDGGLVHMGNIDLQVDYNQNAAELVLWPFEQFDALWGRSMPMRALFQRLARVAESEATVLISGETGTGKELVARAIHNHSRRATQPFIVVDCGALAESLLEAELFGHARGAYTGAANARPGAIEAADGGTVFLDEVGELPLAMQPKLLRAIESRMVRRLGENQHRKVNVRFLAATHRDLAAMVNAGTFREDLYFRLSVLPVTVPPLRERTEDIALLVDKLLPPGTEGTVSPELIHELTRKPWPGNVRELRNFVERALALGAREALDMPRRTSSPDVSAPPNASATTPTPPGGPEVLPPVNIDEAFKTIRDRWLEHLERAYLQAMMERHHRDTAAIAQASGLDRSYVYRLIRKHEL